MATVRMIVCVCVCVCVCKRDREKERGREGTNLGCAEQTDALVARDIHTCATSIPGALATFSDGDAEAVVARPRWVEILCGHALEDIGLQSRPLQNQQQHLKRVLVYVSVYLRVCACVVFAQCLCVCVCVCVRANLLPNYPPDGRLWRSCPR